MSVKIRLRREGRKKLPFYSIVIADARSPRNGKYIEKIGTYNPLVLTENSKKVNINIDQIKYWLSKGAQPTKTVHRLLIQIKILPTIS